LYGDQVWKYDDVGPIKLLESVDIGYQTVSKDELNRVTWFWKRRPRVASVVAWIFWLITAIGVPFWVMRPCLGAPVLIAGIAVVSWTIVRSVRWRRDYELSVDRLTRTSGNGSAAYDCNVVP
jgi:hypothetical protein